MKQFIVMPRTVDTLTSYVRRFRDLCRMDPLPYVLLARFLIQISLLFFHLLRCH